MNNLLCHTGNLGSLGSWGIWGWIWITLNLVFWVGLLAGLTLLIVRAIRLARVPASDAPYATTGQPNTKEILQARYARGEVTREQYEIMKQGLDNTKKGELR